MRRPCPIPGHPPYTGRRCPACEKQRDKRRGTAKQRGYGAEHKRVRGELRDTLPDFCGYGCGTLLMPDGDWVAAHNVDGQPEYGYRVSCRRCNERAKQRG